MCPSDPGAMYRTNVDGVRTVVGAAAEAGVRRVVLTSSAATIGESEGTVANEETAHAGVFLSHYARSKYLGELAFFEEASRWGIEAVAVNPSSVQGPGRASGSTLILRLALNMKRPVAVDTTLSIVDVDDCADAHLLAAERGTDGSRYLISGASITVTRGGGVALRDRRPSDQAHHDSPRRWRAWPTRSLRWPDSFGVTARSASRCCARCSTAIGSMSRDRSTTSGCRTRRSPRRLSEPCSGWHRKDSSTADLRRAAQIALLGPIGTLSPRGRSPHLRTRTLRA